jgi:4-amino-4-deoxy-L-arabinose transferase-like glycosyltransferase
MLGALVLALLGCLLGLVAEPAPGLHGGIGEQLLDLLHLAGTLALALALLLGPGIAWRALAGPERPLGLGFLFLPGMLALIAIGGLAWALAGSANPRAVCLAVFVPALAALGGALLWGEPGQIFDPDERRTLLVVGCVLGLAVARALWSLGPEGELYAGSISRTLEVGDRPDSRISFIVPTLIANDGGPYGSLGNEQFSPYNFSSRGPLPGLAAAPLVLMSGGHPPAGYPEQPWAPFDAQGFMAYRLAMMAFACTAFLSLWDLVRRLGGAGAAYLAVLLAATTPFLVHEVWFTWPKMLAASFVLLAATCVITRRPLRGGLLAGLGYLMHPVALLSLPALGLISLWPLRGARWLRPRLVQGLMLVAGIAILALAWKLVNGSHYDQSGFLNYFTEANPDPHPAFGPWLEFRLRSLANTTVPLLLLATSTTNFAINVVGGISPPVVHFFFQYWNTVPFGVGIVFFPLLLVGLFRAGRRWPWAILVTVVVPLLAFAVYWGSSTTGMMREGLQAWTLTMFAVVACEQAASGFGWMRSRPIRILLTLRVVEVMAVAALPTLATRHQLIAGTFKLTDAVAVLGMLGFGAALAALVWNGAGAVHREREEAT